MFQTKTGSLIKMAEHSSLDETREDCEISGLNGHVEIYI